MHKIPEIKKGQVIDASPVKSFFVTMLTRDIRLEDAVLDLLDNCVDGILRNNEEKAGTKPYKGFGAHIEFNDSHFSISDNCGGIPYDLIDYAFRMGRPEEREDNNKETVGIYGIGMKRAIFKIGKSALVQTQNDKFSYDVEYKAAWLKKENDWSLPISKGKRRGEDGTTVYITQLHGDIATEFGEEFESFESRLGEMIAANYAYIIEKGFEIKVNKTIIRPRSIKLVFGSKPAGKKMPAILPFIWETTTSSGVSIFLSVGFTRRLPTQEEMDGELDHPKYSSENAGWTIICNDRVVLHADKTELTGWGEANVPQYHSQFIAISGIVEFHAKNATLLPTTTTKRGIDSSSRLYLQVKNKMREGMKLFTNYTNKWKAHLDESKDQIESEPALSLDEIKKKSKGLKKSSSRGAVIPGSQFVPVLPMPTAKESGMKRISFSKDLSEIQTIAIYLFDDSNADPSAVGERCFDMILKEADK